MVGGDVHERLSRPGGAHDQVQEQGPAFQRPETPPQVVPYGTVVYHSDYTCASELAGMTCWNTTTGHGAFMSNMNTTTF